MNTLSSPIPVPPPRPPRTRNATDDAQPWREPHRNRSVKPVSFVEAMIAEVRRVVWPTGADVCAASIVTVGLLGFLTIYIQGLTVAAQVLFGALGFGTR